MESLLKLITILWLSTENPYRTYGFIHPTQKSVVDNNEAGSDRNKTGDVF